MHYSKTWAKMLVFWINLANMYWLFCISGDQFLAGAAMYETLVNSMVTSNHKKVWHMCSNPWLGQLVYFPHKSDGLVPVVPTWNTSVHTTAFKPPCNNVDHKQMLCLLYVKVYYILILCTAELNWAHFVTYHCAVKGTDHACGNDCTPQIHTSYCREREGFRHTQLSKTKQL